MSGKYSTFDSFLKRTLSNKEYKEVKIYEPCVVTSSREKRAFRFAFLTRNKLYITENPPKSLLYFVDLKDVIDVKLINDKANFLQAELRESVQHIVVKHVNASGVLPKNSKYIDVSASTSMDSSKQTDSFSLYSNDDSLEKSRYSAPLLCAYSTVTIASMRGSSDSSFTNRSSSTEPTKPCELKEGAHGTTSKWFLSDPYTTQVIHSESLLVQNIDQLHLYILNDSTTFLPMLHAVWRNSIIYHNFSSDRRQWSSQEQNELTMKFDDVALSPPAGSEKSSLDGSTRTLFSDLKHELLHADTVESIYRLYNELKVAAGHDILIKVLFWKDETLLVHSAQLAQTCVSGSLSTNIDSRADEIELAILVLETVALMLRETEAVTPCYKVMQECSFEFLRKFINTLLCTPSMQSLTWDLSSLTSEYSMAATEVLYELLNCAQQITWVLHVKSQVFSSAKLLDMISGSKYLCSYLDSLMKICVHAWNANEKTSSNSKAFLPSQAVQVFHLFSVLQRFIAGSSAVSQYAKENFVEEFKYYIHPNSLPHKFPEKYPISGIARSVVHAVGYHITQ